MVAVAARPSATMKAIVQEGSGSADVLHLREVDRPVIAADQVLVRVRAASVNALDWHTLHMGRVVGLVGALMRQPPDNPVRGVDLAGVVEAVGESVTGLRPGDEVFGVGRGTFAEYAIAFERGLAPKPAQLSFEQASTMGVAAITALQGLRDKGHVQPGQRVLVNGAGGGVGTYAVQIAKALGAHVTAVTGPKNVELVRSIGPDEVIDRSTEDFARRGQRYDVVLDVAADRSLGTLRRVLTPTGTLVLAGAAKGGILFLVGRLLKAFLISRFVDERVLFFVSKIRRDDLVALAELVEAGTLCPVVDRTYALSEAREAVRYVGTGQARAKVVITIG